ncbi:MAG TPA: archaeal proteasome endopeptidase complex subunit beta [Halobacteriales archaeon]|jgi:proteasome beta subunit|uniref:archaeal proteasome endopeptidase complex subunit beta n=1 Tax=Candidatus Hikarchaeum yamanae TaxID=2675326 RepID=UPI0017B94CD1|nr:archaeal proteasome endopeptidase complex subunit beta [Halobacteriales archaeon]|tara:strand:- start:7913 stop:8644 length:732 start_codon:yes stop_codon:yes gene_type:complete
MMTTTSDTDSRISTRRKLFSNPYGPELGNVPQQKMGREEMEEIVKTGTTTIGLSTAEGVVLATDMRASLGGRFIASKDVQKVEQVHPNAAVTMCGSVGGAQAFIRSLKAETNLYGMRRGKEMSIKALATLAGNFLRSNWTVFLISPILGGVDKEGNQVYSLDIGGAVMLDNYVATGSGMQLAYGVLEDKYEEGMTNKEASSVAAQAIKSASQRDAASGDGIYLSVITEEGVDIQGFKDFKGLI